MTFDLVRLSYFKTKKDFQLYFSFDMVFILSCKLVFKHPTYFIFEHKFHNRIRPPYPLSIFTALAVEASPYA